MRFSPRKFHWPFRSLSYKQWGLVAGATFLVCCLASVAMWPRPPRDTDTSLDDLLQQALNLHRPIRPEPARFLARTHLPPRREEYVSGSPGSGRFSDVTDLMKIHDTRVWWESENDTLDTEDDHVMHKAMEVPMRRLIELVHAAGGTLEVHDAYRPSGIHSKVSLHREGRAVDITCDQLGLEKLAKLAWAAGFDWVYYEVPRNGGAHVHASVRANRANYLVKSK